MRDIKVIEADIAKLQAELADTKAHHAQRDAAVHILKNLGWTWSAKGGWKKPIAAYKVFDSKSMSHVKARDWVKYDAGIVGYYAYVRRVRGGFADISMVQRVTPFGASVGDSAVTVSCSQLKVVSHDEIVKNLK